MECVNWAKYHKNVSILFLDHFLDYNAEIGDSVGENSEPLLCRLEDGVVYTHGLTMLMFYGDPLLSELLKLLIVLLKQVYTTTEFA